MAKPVTTRKSLTDLPDLPENEPHQETPETVAEAADTNELKKIEEVLEDAEVSGGTIRLERKGPNDLKWQYIAKFKVEDFSHEHIQKVYGGGDYRAQTFRSNGAFYKRFEFAIDYRFKGAMDALPIQDPKAIPGTTNDLALQMAGQQQSTAMLMDIMNKAQASSNQNMMLIMNMMQEGSKQNMAMMSGMFQAMAAAFNQPKADPTVALMPLLLEMVKRPESNGGKGSNIMDVIAAVRELNALAKGEAPPKEEKEEDMLDKVMKYGGPIVTALLTRQPLQMPGAVPPGAGQVIEMPPATAPAALPRVVPTPPPATVSTPELDKINAYMELLIMAAEKNSDPSAYAQMMSDMLSDEHFNTLIGELQAPDWFAKVASGNPRILAQEAWFTQLRTELFDMVETQDEQQHPIAQPNGTTGATTGQGPTAATGS